MMLAYPNYSKCNWVPLIDLAHYFSIRIILDLWDWISSLFFLFLKNKRLPFLFSFWFNS